MRQKKKTVVERSMSVYRWLLCAYPPAFRERYGQEMEQVFRDAVQDAWRERDWAGVAVLWGHTLRDLLASATRERLTPAPGLSVADILMWEFPEWIVAPFRIVMSLMIVLLCWGLLFVRWTGEQIDAGRSQTTVWTFLAAVLMAGLAYRFGAARLSPRARKVGARALLLACALLITAKGLTEAYTLLVVAGLPRALWDAEEDPLLTTLFSMGLYVLYLAVTSSGSLFGLVTLDPVRQMAAKTGPFVCGFVFLAIIVLGWLPVTSAVKRRWNAFQAHFRT